MTDLSKPLVRRIRTEDDRRDLIVTITREWVEIRGSGTSRCVLVRWPAIVQAGHTPPEIPAKYVLNKIGWLLAP